MNISLYHIVQFHTITPSSWPSSTVESNLAPSRHFNQPEMASKSQSLHVVATWDCSGLFMF